MRLRALAYQHLSLAHRLLLHQVEPLARPWYSSHLPWLTRSHNLDHLSLPRPPRTLPHHDEPLLGAVTRGHLQKLVPNQRTCHLTLG
jgi:hypothetical protein